MFDTLIVQPLFNLLIFILAYTPGHSFGLAIIIFTIIVRFAMWPLLKKQLIQQKAMKELAPEVAKVKKQAKGNREKEAQMLMELYKEKQINPFSSIGLLLVQLPILFGLFSVLRRIFDEGEIGREMYSFLSENIPYVSELITSPTMLDPNFIGINLAESSVLLAAFAGGAQFFQAKMLAPAKTDDDDKQAQAMSKMMVIFPAITFVFALSFQGALALYWGMSSLVALLQQYFVMHKNVESLRSVVFKNYTPKPKQKGARKQVRSKIKE